MVTRHLLILLLLTGLAACNQQTPEQAAALTAARAPMESRVPGQADYIIGPGDTLSIFVYRLPELSTDLPVRPDGRLSMPLISDIVAAGKTPTQLGKEIETRLKE